MKLNPEFRSLSTVPRILVRFFCWCSGFIRVSPILYWISRIRWIQLEISQVWLKVTESFYVSPTHSWLFGVMVMTPDWISVGCEFEYRNFCFWKERPSLISPNFKFKIGKTQLLVSFAETTCDVNYWLFGQWSRSKIYNLPPNAHLTRCQTLTFPTGFWNFSWRC